MKYLATIILATSILSAHAGTVEKINRHTWIHGSEDCATNTDPAIETFRYDESSYILRQNKCLDSEAPFIYVLFGEHTVFVQDTGATEDAGQFPLYETLQRLIDSRKQATPGRELKLLVTHSHGHRDHTAGDSQFRGKPGVTLVEPGAPSIQKYFGFTDWPNGTATVDLGRRKLTVFPLPGHKEDSIAVYDPHTRWLLSGDTFYPGRLYIGEWDSYRASIARLVDFSKTHRISALMGTHIEMSRTPGQDYPMGSSYQPEEAGLALLPEDLLLLDATLSEIGNEPEKRVMDKFIVRPVSKIEKILTWVAKRLGL